MNDETYEVLCNHPGGNVIVVSKESSRVVLQQDMRDTSGWWCYWNFRVVGAEGRILIFEFSNGDVVGPWGPAISDDAITWDWADAQSIIDHKSFAYSFSEDEKVVYFCFSLPYTMQNFEHFCEKEITCCEKRILTTSVKGYAVPVLAMGNKESGKHVLLTSRHHASDTAASYILEGIILELMKDESKDLLNDFQFHIVPIVDMDGVENGDQGKNRKPHDHNQDYIDCPIYKETAAIMEYIKHKNLIAGFDIHASGLWGGNNDLPYLALEREPYLEEAKKFSDILLNVTRDNEKIGKMTYYKGHDIVMPHKPWVSRDFFCRSGAILVCGIEAPNFGNQKAVSTVSNLRCFGEDFGRAIRIYLLSPTNIF